MSNFPFKPSSSCKGDGVREGPRIPTKIEYYKDVKEKSNVISFLFVLGKKKTVSKNRSETGPTLRLFKNRVLLHNITSIKKSHHNFIKVVIFGRVTRDERKWIVSIYII